MFWSNAHVMKFIAVTRETNTITPRSAIELYFVLVCSLHSEHKFFVMAYNLINKRMDS